MDNRAIYIKVDGTTEIKHEMPSLEEMQSFVGGDIQPVSIRYKGRAARMVCNEEGRLKRLPCNLIASRLFVAAGGSFIVGNVIVLQGYQI